MTTSKTPAVTLAKRLKLNKQLHSAIKEGAIENVSELLRQGAEPFCWDEEHYSSALMAAIESDQLDIAKLLIANLLPDMIWDVDRYGNSALMVAVARRKAKFIELLLPLSIIEWKNIGGQTARTMAMELGFFPYVKMIDAYVALKKEKAALARVSKLPRKSKKSNLETGL